MKNFKKEAYHTIKIKDNVYQVVVKRKKYIIKIFNLSFLRIMIDYMKRGRYIAFQNEITIYKGLKNSSFDFFYYPKLMKTNGKNYMIIEYIEGKRGWDSKVIPKETLMRALLEFQFTNLSIKANWLQKLLMLWFRKVPCKILRWSFLIIKTPQDIVTALKCLFLTLKIVVLLKPTDEILVHNDLFHFNNLITGVDRNLYFYDFEYVMKENKWILIDILDMSFDLNTLKLRTDLFAEYLKQISANTIIYQYILNNALEITRIILIRKLLGAILILAKGLPKNLEYRKFLNDILLSKKEYQRWYITNIKPLFL